MYCSQGSAELVSVSAVVSNSISGQGEYYFGILTKLADPGSDVMTSGYQDEGINEVVIFGGIFKEDSSSGGCISLKP